MGGRQPRALSDSDYTLSCSLAALAIPPRCVSTFSPYRIGIRVSFHRRLLTARTISDQCSVETNQIRIVGHRYAFIGPVEA
jgi:hypothetical protein